MLSCKTDPSKKITDSGPEIHQVTAGEVLQALSYTYVRVSSQDSDYWIAINKSEVIPGETYYWSEGVAMKDFTSKELKRTFPFIYLVQDLTGNSGLTNHPTPGFQVSGHSKPPVKNGLSLKPARGGITLAQLYAGRSTWQDKTVKIRGEVVKFNGGIMNKNWIHIQDGTRSGNDYDLAVTSQDVVKVGDIVVFQGIISLNRDFGAGYYYDVIMEDARLDKSAE